MIDWKKEIKLPSPSSLRGRISRPSMPGRPSLPSRPRRGASVNAAAPRASKPRRSSPSMPKTNIKGPNIKVPKFANDLYADLRDRRLLPLVALLLVAIVAAPILLKDKGGSESTAPPITAAPEAQPSDASFAVVPAESGLRDYHKRLGHRQARDPFAQPTAKASSSGGGGSSGGATESAEAAGGSSEPAAAVAGEVAAGTEPESEVAPSSSPSSSSGSSSSGSESGGAPASAPQSGKTTDSTTSVVVEKEITGYSIDAKLGFVGATKPMIGIPEMTKLPTPKEPIAIYLGPSKDKKGALFLLGSLVSAYYGSGHCTLDKQSCMVLELRPGKTATLVYGLEAKRFKISLEQIRPEIAESESGSTVTKTHSH